MTSQWILQKTNTHLPHVQREEYFEYLNLLVFSFSLTHSGSGKED